MACPHSTNLKGDSLRLLVVIIGEPCMCVQVALHAVEFTDVQS